MVAASVAQLMLKLKPFSSANLIQPMNTTLLLVLLALATSIIGVIALGGDWANRNLDEANSKSRDFLAPKPMPIVKLRPKKRARIGGRK